ncbi:putative T7SS-secreted protein [Streptomyces sp. ODS28]|uniref:putative T7SS-secreted protein n=1 Tax=Streptomyces sp. ODS28 TaxID=3136688 RepID=UPI0031E5C08C
MAEEQGWPGLQFNPAKGDAFTVRSLAHDVRTVGDELGEALRLLDSIGRSEGVWEGRAADAFGKKVGELPKLLRQGKDSMHDCARALETWHDRLTGMQKEAGGLERDARRARQRAEHAEAARTSARQAHQQAISDMVPPEQEQKASRHADDAATDADRAEDHLQDIIDRAKKLEDRWETLAGEAERAILKASENHPPDPGVWDRLKDGVKEAWRASKDWLVDNADLLSAVSSGLAAVGLVLSLTGVGAPVGLVLASMGAAGGAMAGHWMGRERGNGTSMAKIGMDGLGLLPGVGAIKGFATAGRGLTLARGAGMAARGEAATAGLSESFTNPLSMKAAHWAAGKFGKTLPDSQLMQIPIKGAGSASNGHRWAESHLDDGKQTLAPAQPSPQPFVQATS